MRFTCSLLERAVEVRLAVVGSGPAGMYCAQSLLSSPLNPRVDVFEKSPVPFGLIRFGVAPDHVDVKNCIVGLERMINRAGDRFRFFGNVNVGKDVSVRNLAQLYDGVILAFGAQEERPLVPKPIDGSNCFSARQIVGWYNGEPSCQDIRPILNAGSTAVILGQGNVALDVARVFLKSPDELQHTDITEPALNALRGSTIKKVILIGRRGPLQVSFTTKELRELTKLNDTTPIVREEDLKEVESLYTLLPRARQRLAQLLLTTSQLNRSMQVHTRKQWELRFLLSFKDIEYEKATCRVTFTRNILEQDLKDLRHAKAYPTDLTEVIPCSLLVYSFGYRSVNIEPGLLPFDPHKRIILTDDRGRVKGSSNLYACGWCATGPVGELAQTQSTAKAVAMNVAEDLLDANASSRANMDIKQMLIERNVRWVDWDQWKKLDETEVRRGQLANKLRQKVVDEEEMLQIALEKAHIAKPVV
ncbi:NADPH:adrenodoxin oxidoreductase [Trichuris trichiura]|uniref:NADPH:adrenodoxin oxidoreductase, mitochondrial n=1 Tax=Trichuris trichiura TaxID=36087 RepID=A0A077YY30_TRITR|nr:NADPH:adrenodoxin oxidoreductase [Trichuris trichiura]